ncbi:C3 and PZP-like alpha-2-macroglobulin domain-containing protein 8 [Ruditapes philippinarum]|uniref:C3 and PZP-like alpha-2-macroglobulin domain-containing protein 8 n=1 Tax=Ruditapes philippinarum TaxID=129788 RepID=UPI00295ABDF7|nr:C3 and PZP-like alpha-2-macroglobulin domain-containing protein 8 [Ruditapes philippinarum]
MPPMPDSMPLMAAGPPMLMDGLAKDNILEPGPSLEEIVRTRFPDTWLWDDYRIGSSGEINVNLNVPDSMTTWVTSVFALNPKTGFGIYDLKPEVTVRKMFFLTMDLPASIVLGEEFLLQISVFNNYPVTKLVFIRITMSDNPNNPIPASAEVKGNDGHSTFIRFQPEKIGVLNITVKAFIMDNMFFSVPDKIMKSVVVRPNGVFKTTNEQHLISVTPASSPVTKQITIITPDNMVENSKFTTIIITGNFMVPSIEGLDSLIKIPSGCGEQNMIHFAPTIYITDYLTIVGKLTAEIRLKSAESLHEGLQQELKFKRYDGSFSAFGNRDSSGSSWLTAFVLKCFGQAKGLIQIDDKIMVNAMTWLLRYQNSDGSFREPGRVLDYQMQGGTSSGITMSAFIIISLLENKNMGGVQGLTSAITKASSYLEGKLHDVTDSYTLAILCYALASANSHLRSTCYMKLKDAAIYDDDKVHWEANRKVSKREVGTQVLTDRAPAKDIEASSYALLTYMKLGYFSEAFPIVTWLVSQRNPTGGQSSTQDTIISIQAMAEYASSGNGAPGPGYGVFFRLSSSGNFKHEYSINSATFDFVHRIEVPSDVETITVLVNGSGLAVIDVSTSYYVTGNEIDDKIGVNVTVTTELINTVSIKSCLRWNGRLDSGMLLMEVEMPTGFQSNATVLNRQSIIMKHETNGRIIALYFNGVKPSTSICVDVKMDRVDPVVKSQACHVKAYDYYDPVHQAITRYEFGLLKSSNICNICPMCGFCTSADN